MNREYLAALEDIVKRGHGAGLYGRLADFEIVAIAGVLLELVKLSKAKPKKQLTDLEQAIEEEEERHGR